jgi:mRNA interferase RelE/StbE
MYKVEIENRCLKELKRLDREAVQKAFRIIEDQITKDPYNAKALSGSFKGFYSYRFGNYRIVYEIFDNTLTVIVLRIGHRKNVYDGL